VPALHWLADQDAKPKSAFEHYDTIWGTGGIWARGRGTGFGPPRVQL